jgi:hypothetical protein
MAVGKNEGRDYGIVIYLLLVSVVDISALSSATTPSPGIE